MTRHLKSAELGKSLASCAAVIMSAPAGLHLSIDGKEMRGTTPPVKKHALVQVAGLWPEEGKLSFGQVRGGDKTNEITAIPELLGRFSCAIISIDAIGCQKTIVEKISEEKADYVIALKKKQGVLFTNNSSFTAGLVLEKQNAYPAPEGRYLCSKERQTKQSPSGATPMMDGAVIG